MAINIVEYNLMRLFREQRLFPLGGDLLELGEASWYGDLPPDALRADIAKYAKPEEQAEMLAALDEAIRSGRPTASWDIARLYWRAFLQPASITSIDFHGTERALKLDLNYPIDLKRQYHVVNNCGTLEHIFNVGQAFKTIHDHTLPGGFMIHQSPFSGWVDHGFYNFNPTLYWDLAALNNYHIPLFIYAEVMPPKTVQLQSREQILHMVKNNQIGKNSLLIIVLRRPDDAQPFRMPFQGFYAGNLSPDAAEAWSTLR